MDQESDLSEQQPGEIRHQMEETRSDLTNKLEALEQKVMDTVADAQSAVTDTVETVKQSVDRTVQAVQDTVQDTVDSVKHALDLERHVQRHPWAMLLGSLAAGYVLGRLLSRRRRVTREVIQSPAEAWPAAPEAGRRLLDVRPNGTRSPPMPPVPQPCVPEPSLYHEVTEKFAPEIQKLKSLAIGTLMSLARDMVTQSVAPPLGLELEQVIDRVTSKLGGMPLSRPVLDLPAASTCTTNQTRG